MKNKGIYYGSLLLVVVANVGYHLSSRSIPAQGNQFLGVGLAYIIAFLVCMICVILFKKPTLKEDLKQYHTNKKTNNICHSYTEKMISRFRYFTAYQMISDTCKKY